MAAVTLLTCEDADAVTDPRSCGTSQGTSTVINVDATFVEGARSEKRLLLAQSSAHE